MGTRRWGPYTGDAGRVPVGAIITVLILAGAAWGAYWFLDDQGFINGGDAQADAAATPVDDDGNDAPPWLDTSQYVMPATIEASGDRPEMYEAPSWLWEVNDGSWDLTVIREGEGDGEEALAERQSLVLVSPTDDLFLVTEELRNDYLMSVAHWDPDIDVAWMRRGGRPGATVVTALDLPTGVAEGQWDDGAVPAVNNVDGDIANVGYVGLQPDSLELWEAFTDNSYATGVFWRDGEEFVPSLIESRIERMSAQGFGDGDGVEMWLDINGQRAVYHGTWHSEDGEPQDEEWIIHDLSDDSFEAVSVPVPFYGCTPTDAVRRGQFEGRLIRADCGGDEYLLDPYEGEFPQRVE